MEHYNHYVEQIKYNYYLEQIKRIIPFSSVSFKLRGDGENFQTNWMHLNEESAKELISLLHERFPSLKNDHNEKT
jgi:hypothetical protein